MPACLRHRQRLISDLVLCPRLGLEVQLLTPLFLGLMFFLSRTISGLSVLLFPSNTGKGLLNTFKDTAEKKTSVIVLAIFLVLGAAWLIYLNVLTGSAMVLAAFICLIYLYVISRRQFGGMSGDLAGYFLQLCELVMLTSIVIIQKVVSS